MRAGRCRLLPSRGRSSAGDTAVGRGGAEARFGGDRIGFVQATAEARVAIAKPESLKAMTAADYRGTTVQSTVAAPVLMVN
jgi:hypothetical protein